MFLLSSGLALAAARGGDWPSTQWTHEGENIVVKSLRRAHEAAGPEVQGWHETTNSRGAAASWTNVVMRASEGAEHYGIMFSKKRMLGKQMPGEDDQVAVYMHQDKDAFASLERGGPAPTLTLVPVKPAAARSLDAKRGRAGSRNAAKSTVARRLRAQQEEDLEEEDEAEEEEEEEETGMAMLQMIDPVVDPYTATVLAMPWGPWGAYVYAGIYPVFMGAAMAKAAQQDLERDGAVASLPSLEVEMPGSARPVSFRKFAELEKFLPVAPLPLFFYPWGRAAAPQPHASPTHRHTASTATRPAPLASALTPPHFRSGWPWARPTSPLPSRRAPRSPRWAWTPSLSCGRPSSRPPPPLRRRWTGSGRPT